MIEELSAKQAEMQAELAELRTLATAVPQAKASGWDEVVASEKEAMYAALHGLQLTVSELRSEMALRLSASSAHSVSEGEKVCRVRYAGRVSWKWIGAQVPSIIYNAGMHFR